MVSYTPLIKLFSVIIHQQARAVNFTDFTDVFIAGSGTNLDNKSCQMTKTNNSCCAAGNMDGVIKTTSHTDRNV